MEGTETISLALRLSWAEALVKSYRRLECRP